MHLKTKITLVLDADEAADNAHILGLIASDRHIDHEDQAKAKVMSDRMLNLSVAAGKAFEITKNANG